MEEVKTQVKVKEVEKLTSQNISVVDTPSCVVYNPDGSAVITIPSTVF